MQKINSSDGNFHAGNPATGTLGTVVTRDWAQCIQDELVNICAHVGIALDPDDNGQIIKAIVAMTSKVIPSGPSTDVPAGTFVGQQHMHPDAGMITVWSLNPTVWKNAAGVVIAP